MSMSMKDEAKKARDARLSATNRMIETHGDTPPPKVSQGPKLPREKYRRLERVPQRILSRVA
jgi:hypothetical protein